MQCGDGLDFLDPLSRDEPSPLGERLETPCQSQGHAFEQTSMGHVREWMPIQNALQIGHETQPVWNLSHASEEDSSARHIAVRTQVFGVAGIANDGFGRNAAKTKGRRSQARRANHDVGLMRGLFETGCDFYGRSIRLQLGGEGAEPFRVACAKYYAFDEWRQASGTAGTHIPCCSNNEKR